MSGGPILHKDYGDEIVGCGVISRGTSFGGDESTMAAALWPAYSFILRTYEVKVINRCPSSTWRTEDG